MKQLVRFNGKGSDRRPEDVEAIDENWEKIDWSK